MSTSGRRALVYLVVAVVVFSIAVVLAQSRDIGAGWAVVALIVLTTAMVGHDARSRGLTVLWGLWALTLIGMVMYVREVRRQSPPT